MTRTEFFDQLYDDFKQEPPRTERITRCIHDLVEALCKFVPNRPDLHERIGADILVEEVGVHTMYRIVNGLIRWIKQFQAPYQDEITNRWSTEFETTTDHALFLRNFFEEYYAHVETVYQEVWAARHRMVHGESVVPPERRPVVKHTNGVPDVLRTGL